MSQQSTAPAPPIPAPEPDDEGFWDAAKRGELAMHQCTNCNTLSYPPRSVCSSCFIDPPSFTWAPVSGKGILRTWTVIRDAFLPGFTGYTPYVVGEIEIPEEPDIRMVARLVDVEPEQLQIGMQMLVDFVDGGESMRIPVFRLASQSTEEKAR